MSTIQKLRKYIPILVLFVSSCITPYDAKIKESIMRIAVEGLIADQPGPHRVRINQSTAFTNGKEGFVVGISGATVYATDNLGNRIDFNETGAGNYLTASVVRGVAGRSYRLRIKLSDGREYVSEPDLLRPVPAIDSIYSEYDANAKQFNLYVDLTDSPAPGEGYLWDWKHYERAFTCAESQPIPGTGPPAAQSPCLDCCTRCWDVSRCYTCINIAGDQYVNGNQIRRQLITEVPYNSRSRYYLMIEQRSLSPAAFRFWNAVKVQSSSTGGPFDAAPAPVTGNISNAVDNTEKVLGFFSAAGVTLRQHWVVRSEIAENPAIPAPSFCPTVIGPPPACAPCVEAEGSRTQKAPPKWDD